MKTLLEKTRRVNKLLQKSGHAVSFSEMAGVLSELVSANVYVVGKRGKILGYALQDEFECDIMRDEVLKLERFPADYAESLLRITETTPNTCQENHMCTFKRGQKCISEEKLTTLVPVNGGGERLGTLILSRFRQPFNEEDLILGEYGATVVGMEMLHSKADRIEDEARKKAAVQVALGTLSYSELEAVQHIFDELDGNEGLLVASKIADRVGITRSVIVNALRKFESAGVIESRSLGMKGTHIKVLNDRLVEELRKLR